MNLEKDFLLSIYRAMLRIRLCEESLVQPILDGVIKTPCHLYSGQEAVAVGICAALRQDDQIFGNHRSHGHYLAKGGDMNTMVAEIYCKKAGCSRGRGGSMHLVAPDVGMLGSAPIVAGTVSLATGAALASDIRGNDRVAVSFFGDGATGEGVVYESLNLAALRKLPLIFVCENNLYATHMPIEECRTKKSISDIASPFCITTHSIDGNNVLDVYNTAANAVQQCREGHGPVFIECNTYRLRGHVGPDDNIQGTHTDIRPPHEFEAWKLRDPLVVYRNILEKHCDSNEIQIVTQEVSREVQEAHEFAMSSDSPQATEVMDYVFA